MYTDSRTVGTCPHCETAIAPAAVIIRYERGDGEGMYASCPSCGEVVRPDRSA